MSDKVLGVGLEITWHFCHLPNSLRYLKNIFVRSNPKHVFPSPVLSPFL
jgi:hypothetical protein